MGVAYGLWEGLGILLIAPLSYLLFQKPISVLKLSGFVVIVCGIACLKYGVVKK
ncbi:SMR family transporter [Serratia sp. L9]|uniref:SMR family transporter n=1 Tax=Serratia sp. L9 TaxID=3423946 RepID=UPI003D676740